MDNGTGSSSSGKYLVWQDLTVVAGINSSGSRSSKLLLNEVTGYAQPDRIMALMGPSGSGKSTLLDTLAGRLAPNVNMSGNVILNGNRRSLNRTDISYVTQEDVFLGSLTVRETVTYSAHLRLPSKMTNEEKNEVVEECLSKMGLEDCAETYIGNWHLRGISNGEKRRLSICNEILTQPHVLLLDEPTSGLDSASSFFVIWALKNIAYDGRIVICSVHQPSSDVFNLFNDLILIAEGETVYFGEAHMAIKFFSDAGFPCPTRKNPPDHYLRCISSDFDKVSSSPSSLTHFNLTTEEIKGKLINKFKASSNLVDARKRIQEILLTEKLSTKSNKGNSISWFKQLWTLICRTSLYMSREIGYYWVRCVFYILTAVSAGTFFYHVGTSNQAIVSRGKSDGFIYGFLSCLSIGSIPFVIEELKVFRRERFGGHNGEALFVLSNFISTLPFLVLMAFSAGTILYYMVKFHAGFSHYVYFCMNLFCCIVFTENICLIVASLVPNFLMGIGCATSVIVFLMMPSLLFRRVSDLPKFFWQYPMSYLSFAGWAIEGQLKNDMIGMEFDSLIPGEPKLKGEDILREMFGVNPDSSIWWNMVALAGLSVGLKLLFYVVLKYKERSSLFFHRLSAKRTTLRSHLEVASFRKDQYIVSSKRHQTLTPLSSQEGLGSPLP